MGNDVTAADVRATLPGSPGARGQRRRRRGDRVHRRPRLLRAVLAGRGCRMSSAPETRSPADTSQRGSPGPTSGPAAARRATNGRRSPCMTTADSVGGPTTEGTARMTADSEANWFEEAFAGAPLMAILRGMGADRSVVLATTAWDLGIDSVEVPLQTAEDERALREVVALARVRGKSRGCGHDHPRRTGVRGRRGGGGISGLPGARPRGRRAQLVQRGSRSSRASRRRARCSWPYRSVSPG